MEKAPATWQELVEKLSQRFGQPTQELHIILFLIGLESMGHPPAALSKALKERLISLGLCQVLQIPGYYAPVGIDDTGFPVWEPTKRIPFMIPVQEEAFLKDAILIYFQQKWNPIP